MYGPFRDRTMFRMHNEVDAKSPGLFARPLACLLVPLTHLLAPRCSLAPLRSFARLLAHSLTPELMGKWFLSMS